MLWVEIFEVYLGVKSGSKSAAEVGDGARYWKCFSVLWELLTKKAPMVAGAYEVK